MLVLGQIFKGAINLSYANTIGFGVSAREEIKEANLFDPRVCLPYGKTLDGC